MLSRPAMQTTKELTQIPIRQAYFKVIATPGQTQQNTKARRFPVNYGTAAAAFSGLLLALVTQIAQDFCTLLYISVH